MISHDDTPDEVLDIDADRLAQEIAERHAFYIALAQAEYVATHSGNPAHRTLIYAGTRHRTTA